MAERQLPDVPDILEENVFDSGMSIMFNASGRFRDIASLLVRNALSKAIIHAENRNPADTDQVAGLSQYWINTTTKARFFSVAGEDWVDVTPTGTTSSGDDGDDGWTPEFANVADGSRIVQRIVDWNGGGGTKPATGQYLGSTGFVNAIEDATDIRGGPGADGGAGNDGNNGWYPELANVVDGSRIVQRIADWHGGGGTKPATGQYVGESGFTSDIALAIDIRGADGILSLVTDTTLQGDGTTDSPLGVVPNEPTGEIGRIHSVGSYTFGSSATPASGNAGWNSNTLHVNMTDGSSVDNSAVLGSLAQGDYLHIGTTAIVEVIAAPTSASGIYSFSASVLKGTVPTSGNHTLYYIKENRAIIAGAVHGFNIAAGAVDVAKLTAEVLAYWLRTVSTDATLSGDGTPQSPLSVAAPESSDSTAEINIGEYETFGSWTWTSTSLPATGQFYVESGTLKIFETDSDSTDKRTDLEALAVGDRLQFGNLNAFVIGAVGTRSNGVFTFTGTWAELFNVGDFNGTYTVRHIERSNVLVRNIAASGRHLKLNDNLLIETNDPDGDFETLWSGDFNQDSTGSQSLNAGKKFSDYTVLVFEYVGYNSRHEQWFKRDHFQSRGRVEVGVESGKRMSINRASDTSFSKQVSSGNIAITAIYGHRGL